MAVVHIRRRSRDGLEDNPLDSITNVIDVPWRADSRSRHWEALVVGIRKNDCDAIAELLKIFRGGVQFVLNRKILGLSPAELQEQTHEVFRKVLTQISDGDLVDPMQVPRFLGRAVRQVADRYHPKRDSEQSVEPLPTPLAARV